MRTIWILTVTALVAFGCNKNDTEVTSKMPEGKVAHEQDASATKTVNKTTKESKVDPALKDYVYPSSELQGTYSAGDIESVQYMSQDDFATVVTFYKQKFPGSTSASDANAYFGKQNPDGSSLTVTVTKMNTTTQIILKLEKKG